MIGRVAPVYGLPFDATTRYVYTNTAAAAAERFADLVERDDIDENTQSYTYDDPDVGTLVYTKGSGRFLATVDVDIKQIPSLKKIVYIPGEYANGSFDTRAYYRFGDVVSRKSINYNNDEFTEYWICVRPAFGLEGKGDSHWVCLSELPMNNVWHYRASNNNDYYLPTGLGTNEEHMQNLAEMLFAIYDPETWMRNVNNYNDVGLKMFHDFDPKKISYHNEKFWQNVQNAWRQNDILRAALGYNGNGEDFKTMLTDKGLYLLYKGYSWLTTFSWNCTLYQAHYKNHPNEGKERNMHKATYTKETNDLSNKRLDCRKMGPQYIANYEACFDFDDIMHDHAIQPRWTVRHATGKELDAHHRNDPKAAIEGVTEVYRYYRFIDDMDLNKQPEVTERVYETGNISKDNAKVGSFIAKNGRIYDKRELADAEGGGAVAMVVYMGDDLRVEKDKEWNGLAVSLNDLPSEDGKNIHAFADDHTDELCTSNIVSITKNHMAARQDGWAMTQRMRTHACGANHTHPAAEALDKLDKVQDCSEWFIPSSGQWLLILKNQAQWPKDISPYSFIQVYAQYMTTTEFSKINHIRNSSDMNRVSGDIHIFIKDENGGNGGYFETAYKRNRVRVRPVIAFRYGDGGTTNPTEPWKPLEKAQQGCWVGDDGQFYKEVVDVYAGTGFMPVAYVAYYNQLPTIINDKTVHGLAISTYSYDDEQGVSWNDAMAKLPQYTTRLSAATREKYKFTNWFLPSEDDWLKILLKGFGHVPTAEDEKRESLDHFPREDYFNEDSIKNFFKRNNLEASTLKGYYWARDERGDKARYIIFRDGINPSDAEKTDTKTEYGEPMLFRPVIGVEANN